MRRHEEAAEGYDTLKVRLSIRPWSDMYGWWIIPLLVWRRRLSRKVLFHLDYM